MNAAGSGGNKMQIKLTGAATQCINVNAVTVISNLPVMGIGIENFAVMDVI